MSTERSSESTVPYHHGDLRNALIKAGLAILATEGARALSLRAVARRVGVSHAAPYRHFADKDALIAAIAEQGFNMLAAATRAAIERRPGDPVAQLTESGWAYVQFALQHPDHLRVMFSGLLGTPAAHTTLRTAGAAAFNLLVGIVRAGQHAGVMADDAPEQLALAAWASVHGLAVLLIDNQIPAAVAAAGPEQLTRLCTGLFYRGVGVTLRTG